MDFPISIADADPWAIAIHEAGHLAAGFLLGREILKVTISFQDDGKRGCYYSPIDDNKWNDFDEVVILLAGPRAQIELIPESLPDGKARLFEERIILPMPSARRKPAGVYDSTGWGNDIDYVYKLLCYPDAPTRRMPFHLTHRRIVDLAEQRVLEFCRDPGIQECLRFIAKEILETRGIEGPAVAEVIEKSLLSEAAKGKQFLSWQ